MKQYVENIIITVPFLQTKRKAVKLDESYPALVILIVSVGKLHWFFFYLYCGLESPLHVSASIGSNLAFFHRHVIFLIL